MKLHDNCINNQFELKVDILHNLLYMYWTIVYSILYSIAYWSSLEKKDTTRKSQLVDSRVYFFLFYIVFYILLPIGAHLRRWTQSGHLNYELHSTVAHKGLYSQLYH